jgi:hypothetical protein
MQVGPGQDLLDVSGGLRMGRTALTSVDPNQLMVREVCLRAA